MLNERIRNGFERSRMLRVSVIHWDDVPNWRSRAQTAFHPSHFRAISVGLRHFDSGRGCDFLATIPELFSINKRLNFGAPPFRTRTRGLGTAGPLLRAAFRASGRGGYEAASYERGAEEMSPRRGSMESIEGGMATN